MPSIADPYPPTPYPLDRETAPACWLERQRLAAPADAAGTQCEGEV